MSLNTASTQLQKAFGNHLRTLTGTYGWEQIQQKAYKHFQEIGLPDVKTEAYKYTPLTRILTEQFDLSEPNIASPPNNEFLCTYTEPLSQYLPDAYPIVSIDGKLHNTHPISKWPLQVYSFKEAYQQHENLFLNHFNNYNPSSQSDAFATLNTALFSDGVFIYIPDNTVLDKPLYILHLISASLQKGISYPRVFIYIGKNSQVSLVNNWHTLGDNQFFTNAVTDILVGENSQVDHYTLQTKPANTLQVNTIQCYQAKNSVVNHYTFSWDGVLIRNNLYLTLQEPHIESNMYGLYCVDQNKHIDNHTTVDHQQPHTQSNELYRGILAGSGTAVFNGRILVQPSAQKTNAFQSNNNILLSDEASIYSKPQLEIWADDVKCSHGATIGQLDEAQLFYLRARGISEKTARTMLLDAFGKEVITKVRLVGLRNYLEKGFKEYIEQLL